MQLTTLISSCLVFLPCNIEILATSGDAIFCLGYFKYFYTGVFVDREKS